MQGTLRHALQRQFGVCMVDSLVCGRVGMLSAAPSHHGVTDFSVFGAGVKMSPVCNKTATPRGEWSARWLWRSVLCLVALLSARRMMRHLPPTQCVHTGNPDLRTEQPPYRWTVYPLRAPVLLVCLFSARVLAQQNVLQTRFLWSVGTPNISEHMRWYTNAFLYFEVI